ncbi:hypothetical protein DRQ36_07205 [bacterium]|nr:MAG: hypothetical protein DRQ36_07205 [bacterium]
MAGISESKGETKKLASAKLGDGSALEKFRAMVEAQNGDPEICDDVALFPKAQIIKDIPSPRGGFIAEIDTRAIGIAGVELGAGRKLSSDEINPSVGFKIYAKLGDKVERGQPIGKVYAASDDAAEMAIASVQSAYTISPKKGEIPDLIIKSLPD